MKIGKFFEVRKGYVKKQIIPWRGSFCFTHKKIYYWLGLAICFGKNEEAAE